MKCTKLNTCDKVNGMKDEDMPEFIFYPLRDEMCEKCEEREIDDR